MNTRLRVLVVPMLLLVASTAQAGNELFMRWDNCYGDGGLYNKAFACDVNTGTDYLVASFTLDQPLLLVTGMDAGVALTSVSSTLPSWWFFLSAGNCRQSSLSMDWAPPATAVNCVDRWQGQVGGGITAFQTNAANQRLIRLSFGVVAPVSIPAGEETFAFRLRLNHNRTVGSPTCAGCEQPVCLAFGYARITQPVGVGDVSISGATSPNNGSRVTWQPGGSATSVSGGCAPLHMCYGFVTCDAVTPNVSPTWGLIKSMYR